METITTSIETTEQVRLVSEIWELLERLELACGPDAVRAALTAERAILPAHRLRQVRLELERRHRGGPRPIPQIPLVS